MHFTPVNYLLFAPICKMNDVIGSVPSSRVAKPKLSVANRFVLKITRGCNRVHEAYQVGMFD
jgi:hypothetical protein